LWKVLIAPLTRLFTSNVCKARASNLEKRIIEKYLMRFPLLPITPESSVRAIDLIRSYSNSHGLLIGDALTAATALENNLTIVTYNVDDFKFVQDLKWLKPTV
jgi:predicted nucleic acid-binding protein